MKKAIRAAVQGLILIIFVLSNDITAYANGGGAHIVNGDVTYLMPVKHSDIEITSEQLFYKLNDFTGETMFADVTAKYEMHNTSQESSGALVAFVSNNAVGSLEILFQGEPVEIIRSGAFDSNRYPNSNDSKNHWGDFGVWESSYEEIMFVFGTGTISEDYDQFRFIANTIEVTLFEIDFEPNEVCELTVSYTEKATFVSDASYFLSPGTDPRFYFYYLLEPAQYWKDFRDLTITVEMPKGLKTEFSLDGFSLNKKSNTYSAHFESLPDKNLQIVVRASLSRYLFTVFALVALFIALIVLLKKVLFIPIKEEN